MLHFQALPQFMTDITKSNRAVKTALQPKIKGVLTMKKFWKIVYTYDNITYKTEYIPKKIKRSGWWLSHDDEIKIVQVSIVKM